MNLSSVMNSPPGGKGGSVSSRWQVLDDDDCACDYGTNCLFKRSSRLDKCDARKDCECRNVFHAKCKSEAAAAQCAAIAIAIAIAAAQLWKPRREHRRRNRQRTWRHHLHACQARRPRPARPSLQQQHLRKPRREQRRRNRYHMGRSPAWPPW